MRLEIQQGIAIQRKVIALREKSIEAAASNDQETYVASEIERLDAELEMAQFTINQMADWAVTLGQKKAEMLEQQASLQKEASLDCAH